MPRRRTPNPLAAEVGKRIRHLRQEQGLTAEKLAYESDLGSKGHLSDIEKGLTIPTIGTLKAIADRLDVDVLDLVTFPEESDRHALIDSTRRLSTADFKALLRHLKRRKK